MKKGFLTVMSLLALALGVVSCSSDSLDTGFDDAINANIQKYGTRSTSLKMYLGNVEIENAAITRGADTNGNSWGDAMPALPTEEEKNGILAYIRTNPERVAWPGYTYYFVQHVVSSHKIYQYSDKKGTYDVDGSAQINKLEIKEQKNGNGYTPVLHFNNGVCTSPGTNNAAFVTKGFEKASAHDTFGGSDIHNWRLFYWEGNYYLGIDYAMYQNKNKPTIEADGIYDDLIVKILPGKGENPGDNPEGTPEGDTDNNPGGDTDNNPDGDAGNTPDGDSGNTPDGDSGNTPDGGTTITLPGCQDEVEFDIHQQIHTDWNEIKTSIHVRDKNGVAVRAFLPIPEEYQAIPDDFAIRTGKDYVYDEKIEGKFTFADKEYVFPVLVRHSAEGIEILIDCTSEDAKEAIALARGLHDDGITFEIHSYVIPEAAPEQIWGWLKNTNCVDTKNGQWPEDGDICTHTRGQVTSTYYPEEGIHFDERP